MQVQDHLCLEGGIAYLDYCEALPAVTWPCNGHTIALNQSNI